MANTFYIPETVAQVAIGLLSTDLVLAKTFNRDFESEFKGGVGHSINVKKPNTLVANTRSLTATSAITVTDVTEPGVVAVTLDENIYSAVRLSDEDLSLRIEDFGKQVLAPQTDAVARAIEAKAVALMQTVSETLTIAWDPAQPVGTFITARQALRDIGVPVGNLYAAVGTGVAAALLTSKALMDASQSGTSGALRDAVIGRIAGFDVVESNALAPGEMVFYHKDAFTLVLRAPMVPQGVTFGASVSANGGAVRYIRDYDASTLADRSILNVFAGAKVMQKRFVNLAGSASDVTPAIRVLTTTTPA